MKSCLKYTFTTIATNHEATGRAVEVPKLLRSPCCVFKLMGMHRQVNSDILIPTAFGGPCMFGNGRACLFSWSLNILVGFSGIFVGHNSSGPWVTELTNIAQLNTETVTGSAAQFRGFWLNFFSPQDACFLSIPNAKIFLGCMIVFLGNDEISSPSVMWRGAGHVSGEHPAGNNTLLIAKTNEQDFPNLDVHTAVLFCLPCVRNRSLNPVDLSQWKINLA